MVNDNLNSNVPTINTKGPIVSSPQTQNDLRANEITSRNKLTVHIR